MTSKEGFRIRKVMIFCSIQFLDTKSHGNRKSFHWIRSLEVYGLRIPTSRN